MSTMDLQADMLKVITTGGKRYLGVLDETGISIVINDALELGEDKAVSVYIRVWFRLFNMENLDTVKFTEQQGFTVRKLDPDERKRVVRAKADMAEAKKMGMPMWENKCFAELDI